MKDAYIYIFILLAFLIHSGCVSTQKYEEVVFEREQVKQENQSMNETIEQQDKMIKELRAKEVQLQEKIPMIAELERHIKNLSSAQADLKDKYDLLLNENEDLIKTVTVEKSKLSDALASKQRELDIKERELSLVELRLTSQQENLRALREDVQIREQKLAELTRELNAQASVMKQLREKITESLLGFSSDDLTVSERNGRVYVSMSQNLLFAKGSSTIDRQGREAIRRLAEVLNSQPDIRINVEGHTDTDGTQETNWDLSVTRATAVVKELTKLGVAGYRITASGRAFHDPITFNDSEENKSRNRRTEIILSPRLEDILEIVR